MFQFQHITIKNKKLYWTQQIIHFYFANNSGKNPRVETKLSLLQRKFNFGSLLHKIEIQISEY